MPRLQWGHDNGVVEDTSEQRMSPPLHDGFNGATTMESWKTSELTTVRRYRDLMLQWGHDNGVVEDD